MTPFAAHLGSNDLLNLDQFLDERLCGADQKRINFLVPPWCHRSARVVEQVLIQLSGHYFSLRENHGQEWIRTTEGVSQRIYSPPRLATSVPTRRLVSQRRP